MSIYPVPLQEWFPKPSRFHPDADQHLYETARMLVNLYRCVKCNKRCKWNRAWGHHSLPWGYGDIFCSKKCVMGK
jgi:hypothetical protein